MINYEDEADNLLSRVPRGAYPHYSESQLARKANVARVREPKLRFRDASQSEATALLQRHILSAVISAAGLTKKQAQVLSAKAAGYGWADIGRRFGHSKQGAHRIFTQAAAKIRSAWRLCPIAGVDEVYEAEVRRWIPKRR
jgi:hypothetical protein